MSAPIHKDLPLCCCDRPAGGRCMLHCVRVGGDVRGVCPFLFS